MATTGRGKWPLPTAWATWIKGRRYALRRQVAFGDLDDAERAIWSDYFFDTPTTPLRVLVADNATFAVTSADIRLSKRTPAPSTLTEDAVLRELLPSQIGFSSSRPVAHYFSKKAGPAGVLASALSFSAPNGQALLSALQPARVLVTCPEARLSKRIPAPSTQTPDVVLRKWLHTKIAHSSANNGAHLLSEKVGPAGVLASALEFAPFEGAYILSAIQPARVLLGTPAIRLSHRTLVENSHTSDEVASKIFKSSLGYSTVRNQLQYLSKEPGLTGTLASVFSFAVHTPNKVFAVSTGSFTCATTGAAPAASHPPLLAETSGITLIFGAAGIISVNSGNAIAAETGIFQANVHQAITAYGRVFIPDTQALEAAAQPAPLTRALRLTAEAGLFAQDNPVNDMWVGLRALNFPVTAGEFLHEGIYAIIVGPQRPALQTQAGSFSLTGVAALFVGIYKYAFTSNSSYAQTMGFNYFSVEWIPELEKFIVGHYDGASTNEYSTSGDGYSWDQTNYVYNLGTYVGCWVVTHKGPVAGLKWAVSAANVAAGVCAAANTYAGGAWVGKLGSGATAMPNYNYHWRKMRTNGTFAVMVGAAFSNGSAALVNTIPYYATHTPYDHAYWGGAANYPGSDPRDITFGPSAHLYVLDISGKALHSALPTSDYGLSTTLTWSSFSLGALAVPQSLSATSTTIFVSGTYDGAPACWAGPSTAELVRLSAPASGKCAINDNWWFINGETFIWVSDNQGASWVKGPAVAGHCYLACDCDNKNTLSSIYTDVSQAVSVQKLWKMYAEATSVATTVTEAGLTYTVQERRDLTLFADSAEFIQTGTYTLIYGLPRTLLTGAQTYVVTPVDAIFHQTYIQFTTQTSSGYAVDVTYFGTLHWDTYYNSFFYGAQANTSGAAQVFHCTTGVSWDSWSVYSSTDSRHRIRCQAGTRWWSINCTGASTESTYWNSGVSLTRLDGTAGSIGYRDFMYDMKHNGVVGIATGWYNTGDVQYPVSYRINTGVDEYYWSDGTAPGGAYKRIAVGPGNLFYLVDVSTGTDLYVSTTTAAYAFSTYPLGGSAKGIAANSSLVAISGTYGGFPVIWVGPSADSLSRLVAPDYGKIALNDNFIFVVGDTSDYVWASFDEGQTWYRGPAHLGCQACAVDPVRDLMIVGLYSDATHVYPRAQRVVATIAYRTTAEACDFQLTAATASIIGGPTIHVAACAYEVTANSVGIARLFAPFAIGNTDYPVTGHPVSLRRAFPLPVLAGELVYQSGTAALVKTNAVVGTVGGFEASAGSAAFSVARQFSSASAEVVLTLCDCGIKMVNSRMVVDQGLFSLGGFVFLRVARTIYQDQGVFEETPQSAGFRTDRNLAPATQSFALVGSDIDNRRPNRVISVTRAILTVTPSDARVAKAYNLNVVGDTFATTPIPADLRVARKFEAGIGVFYTGWHAVIAAVRVPVAPNLVAYNASDVTLRFGHKIHPPVNSFALSVFDSSIRRTHTVVPTSAGVFAFATSACDFRATWVFHAEMGAFLSLGKPAVVAAHWRRNAEVCGFSITVTSTSFPATRKLFPQPGSLLLPQATAGLRTHRNLAVATGVFSQVAIDDILLADRAVLCSVRDHAVTTKPAGLTVSRRVPAQTGVLETATAQALIWYGWLLPADTAVFALPVASAVLRKGLVHFAEVVVVATSPQDAVLRRGSVLKTEGDNFGTGAFAATLRVGRRLPATRAAFTRYALGVTKLLAGRRTTCTVGAFVAQVNTIVTDRIHRLVALTGVATLQGGTIGILGNFILHNYNFVVDIAAYSISGQAAVRAFRKLSVSRAQFSLTTKPAVQAAALPTSTGVFLASAKTAGLSVTRAQQQAATHYEVSSSATALVAHRVLATQTGSVVLGPLQSAEVVGRRINAETGVFASATEAVLYSSTYAVAALRATVTLEGIEVPIYRTEALLFVGQFEFKLYPEDRFEFNSGQQARFTIEYSQPCFIFYRDSRFTFYINDARLSLE